MTKVRGRLAAAAMTLVSLLAPPAARAERLEKCPVETGVPADVAEAVRAAPSCAQAYEVLNVCRANAAGDVGLAAIVIDMCDKVFSPTLDPAASRAYAAARDACAKRFAHEGGVQGASHQALCEAGVAVVFAHRADLAAMRAKRAPFGALAPVGR
jgi:hypothetical protein